MFKKMNTKNCLELPKQRTKNNGSTTNLEDN